MSFERDGASGGASWVVGVLAVVALASGGASAATLPGSSVPLAGSAFQGGDGNQADQSPYVDWQGLQAAGRVVHSPDPNAADSAFVGGAKEDQPGAWGLTTEAGGVNPGKDNILDAYSAVDQPGADTFLYLAFTREKADGTTFVAFELNQDARLWIEKTGPTLTSAGATLHYTLYVTNPGDLPLPASTVKVSDPACDQPPALVGKADVSGNDSSPRTLDPGDTWTYQCPHKTGLPHSNCTPSTATNTATATAATKGTTVRDHASITTTLDCPGQPPQPPLPPPTPPGPPPPTPIPNPGPTPAAPIAPIAPPGPTPPPAGTIGMAGLRLPHGCLARLSQVQLVGTRINRIQVSVDGQQVRLATLRILQQRASLLPQPFRPGRHRVSVHVTFQPGSGGPPITLNHTVTICSPLPPTGCG